jgi:hypothetical protein
MDLSQTKLSKSEWMNIETPVSEKEKSILQLIVDGFSNINLRRNDTPSLFTYMKIEYSAELEYQLYKQYFEKPIQDMIQKFYPTFYDEDTKSSKKEKKPPALKTRDLIRIQSMDAKVEQQRDAIFEFVLLELSRQLFENLPFLKKTKGQFAFYLYTLIQVKKASVPSTNKYVKEFADQVIQKTQGLTEIKNVLSQAYHFIEKNPYLLKYEDRTLFQHQKQLFSVLRDVTTPKLVLYIAPTGTGKTLSPIGLADKNRIIFVCAARHVGLALAKSAISVGKRVAFAFGCETASDIRLHYFAASVYSRNKRTGGIGKVDNSVGDKVQIMICDVFSYLTAMHYMLAFSPDPDVNDLITYWDEPTITMDYETHDLHEIIHRNWRENKIPVMVLSCATLPKEEEIMDTIQDFRERFEGSDIHSILSYDCRKSISVLNKNGFPVLPHLLFREFQDLQRCVKHCNENKTLLRYFDLSEIVRLIGMADIPECYSPDNYFGGDISQITMNSLKLYYLKVLEVISEEAWPSIYDQIQGLQRPKFTKKTIRKSTSMEAPRHDMGGKPFARTQSMQVLNTTSSDQRSAITKDTNNPATGILLTTEDAYTLTDGPTIFLSEDVEKVGKFYIQQTNISPRVFQSISEKIAQNNLIQEKIDALTHSLEDTAGGELEKEKKMEKDNFSPEIKRIMEQIESVRSQIKMASLDPSYIPNTAQHQRIWKKEDDITSNAFIPSVDEESIRDIMSLDVTDQMKLLLLLGIGMFTRESGIPSPGYLAYMEVMKRLAYNQQLYLILASSDYIYGTNYQFCHGFIGKDLMNMTQQKTIQAMGRIGRNQIQQEYTLRFRDDAMILQLFQKPAENREAVLMNRLFSGNLRFPEPLPFSWLIQN